MPPSARRDLVFAEAMFGDTAGGLPLFVRLDSGVVYRVLAEGPTIVAISPRSRSVPPIGFAPVLFGAGSGNAFRTSVGGEYRVVVLASGPGPFMVHIFNEAADSLSAACVSDTSGDGCFGAENVATRPPRSALHLFLGIILVLFGGAIFGT
jgi:hypothetical protein